MKFNDFYSDLKYSNDKTDNEIINDFYKNYFGRKRKPVKEIITVNDLKRQKQGIDKIIILENGKQITIDEKKRKKDYGDMLLEEWSNEGKKKIGWTGDPDKVTDYIAYIILPSHKIFMLPYELLQRAWVANWEDWKKRYKKPPAPNYGYFTSNIAPNWDALFNALKEEMIKDINLTEPLQEPVIEEIVLFEQKILTKKPKSIKPKPLNLEGQLWTDPKEFGLNEQLTF